MLATLLPFLVYVAARAVPDDESAPARSGEHERAGVVVHDGAHL